MKSLDQKLQILQTKLQNPDSKIRIMIIGLGSVGSYLLDYLVSTANPQLEIVVAGRNYDKMLSDVNIVKTAAAIRRQLRCDIRIEGGCNLEEIDSIAHAIRKWEPDFIINSSRVYAGLKYGTISWSHLRAYGIWTPLSVRFARNIMLAYEQAGSAAITINTSYSDAVIPWLKSAGITHFDFGSGNLNHLIPRMKFHIAQKFGIANINDIDITLAVSHFHDVVISKEGHAEGQDILLDIKYQGQPLAFDKAELLSACKIAMPTDQKRNMMNASSNFDIIHSILTALETHSRIKIHTPGVDGEIGGYPFIIDGTGKAEGYIDESVFTLEAMRAANRKSIYLDGILDVQQGELQYTPELVGKVAQEFGAELPRSVVFETLDATCGFLVERIIRPNI